MGKTFEDHRRGDTFEGISFLIEDYLEDGVTLQPVDLTDVVILAQFKTTPNVPPTFEFKTSDGTITIPEPLSGEFFFTPRKMNYLPFHYIYDVQLTFPNGVIETIPADKWLIYDDISR